MQYHAQAHLGAISCTKLPRPNQASVIRSGKSQQYISHIDCSHYYHYIGDLHFVVATGIVLEFRIHHFIKFSMPQVDVCSKSAFEVKTEDELAINKRNSNQLAWHCRSDPC